MSTPEPEPVTIVCGTIAHVPGCEPVECSECGAALVAAPTTYALIQRGPATVLCYHCAPHRVPGEAMIGLTEEQAQELVDNLGMEKADEIVRVVLGRPIAEFLGKSPGPI